MYRSLILSFSLLLLAAGVAMAVDEGADPVPTDAKELSGMSILGNDEAPKSLYIVPWKSSELGVETSLNMMLSASDVPVDQDVFRRQLEFYEVSTAKQSNQLQPTGGQ